MATAITANKGFKVTPHVLRESRGAKPFKVHNGTNGKIDFNGTEEDWIKMRDAMVDVIQSGTGKGIKGGLQYSVAGKTGTAQVKSIAQGKRYNEALLTDRQLDHGLFVGFAPAENPEIAIAIILENGRGGSAATALARPILDYWLLNKNKKPIRPSAAQVSGGLMTAGLKPSELPSGEVPSSTAPNTNNVNNPDTATNHPALNPNPSQTTPSSAPTNPPATAPTAVVPTNPIESD